MMRQDASLVFKQLWGFLITSIFIAFVFTSLPVNAVNDKKAPVANKVTLNFNDTDISAVISAVSEMTGRNFIVDPRVKGKVTVISHRALKTSEVYEVFLSVLKVHGFAAIPGDNVTKIVPEVNAKQDAIITGQKTVPLSDEFITQVLEIKNVEAAELVPILRPLVPQRGHLAAYPASNVLVISDSGANIRRLKNIISSIDQATGDDIEVVALQHASASEVVRIIQQLSSQDPKQKKNNLIADDRTNSILLGGNKASRLRTKALIAHLDTPVDDGGSTQVVYLRNAVAKDLVTVLTGVSKSVSDAKGNKTSTTKPDAISIQADENTNALVITAPPDIFRSLRAVIRRLDVRRAQVLVEAIIAEVSSNSAQEFGIQWAADSTGKNAVGLVSFGLGNSLTGLLSDPPSLGPGLNLGVGNLEGASRVGALISALSSDGKSNILSTPSLLTLDNEEAEIVVADNVPFLTGSYSGTGGGSTPTNPFQTIQREDVGLTLRITPQINEGNAIKMKVEQEVSSVTSSAQAVDLITNKRSLKTNVIVDDGQMIVLGGLIKEDFQDTEQRVPGLGDVPLLGWFFRYNKTSKIKTNLMVFLQPTILKDAALTSAHTGDKYNFIRGQQLKLREEGFRLASEEDSPLLAENKQFLTLPAPYSESSLSESDDEKLKVIAVPPTMMEKVNDKQSESTDGGKQ
ncbi:MAG: type II secretion system secretin GspD [Gammaproteobacteria bacterium]|nr:type II secretion system secretin GspD [Gammaproteobacteria bacterium]